MYILHQCPRKKCNYFSGRRSLVSLKKKKIKIIEVDDLWNMKSASVETRFVCTNKSGNQDCDTIGDFSSLDLDDPSWRKIAWCDIVVTKFSTWLVVTWDWNPSPGSFLLRLQAGYLIFIQATKPAALVSEQMCRHLHSHISTHPDRIPVRIKSMQKGLWRHDRNHYCVPPREHQNTKDILDPFKVNPEQNKFKGSFEDSTQMLTDDSCRMRSLELPAGD